MRAKPILSVVLPGIRAERWDNLYRSVRVGMPFELILVSPYRPTPLLEAAGNVKFVQDFGSPVRASCIAAALAEGKYLTWAADDGVFFPETVTKAVDILDRDANGRRVVVTKYLEACTSVHPDWYYSLNTAYPRSPYIDESWLIFNSAFMHRSYYDYLGGWDCAFEACPLAHADLAARAQRDGCSAVLIQEPLLDCTHMPGTSGDHAPVYYAHTEHDDPLYRGIYGSEACLHRTRIDINNWKDSPVVWGRRFGASPS